jgi:hypothetical protein
MTELANDTAPVAVPSLTHVPPQTRTIVSGTFVSRARPITGAWGALCTGSADPAPSTIGMNGV